MRAELLANLVEAIAMLDGPSTEEIRRLTRAKVSTVPVAEPGADPADVAAVPPPEALAAAASSLQVEAARWARLRPGEELVYEWRKAVSAAWRPVSRPPDPDNGRDPRRGPGRPSAAHTSMSEARTAT